MADAPIPEAKAWMIKAWRDLETARRAATGEPPFWTATVRRAMETVTLATERAFSNEELAIALLSIALPYDPHAIRCGAAMLGALWAGRSCAWLQGRTRGGDTLARCGRDHPGLGPTE